jgi:hypothetical protein
MGLSDLSDGLLGWDGWRGLGINGMSRPTAQQTCLDGWAPTYSYTLYLNCARSLEAATFY